MSAALFQAVNLSFHFVWRTDTQSLNSVEHCKFQFPVPFNGDAPNSKNALQICNRFALKPKLINILKQILHLIIHVQLTMRICIIYCSVVRENKLRTISIEMNPLKFR